MTVIAVVHERPLRLAHPSLGSRQRVPMSHAISLDLSTGLDALPELDGAARARQFPAKKGWLSRLLNLRPRVGTRERHIRYHCGKGLSLGRSPSLADIESLIRKEGLRSLVNLNTEGEPHEVMSPNVEASWAQALNLRHERVSISAVAPRSEDVGRFLHALECVPRPVFVHSLHGGRAAAMILVHLGLEQRISGTAAVHFAKGLGISCAPDSLRAFAESEVDGRMGLLRRRARLAE